MSSFCRVCGYEPEAPPWGESGERPTYHFCPCCDTQFGRDDDQFDKILSMRKKWLQAGLPWRSTQQSPPDDWNAIEQLGLIPHQFTSLADEPELAALLMS